MTAEQTPEKVRTVTLPADIDPTLAVGYIALISHLHEMNKNLRAALGETPAPRLEIVIGDRAIEPKT